MKIVIPDDYQNIVDRLSCFSLLAGHEVVRHREPAADLDQLVERLHPAEVIVAIRERVVFSRQLIARLPNLRLIALIGRAATTIDHAACLDRNILVSCGASNSPIAPAELTIALILASRRNIALEAERMRRGEWPCTLSHRLSNSTLGIFGLGAIGSIVARAGAGMGMNVLAWGQDSSAAKAKVAGYNFAASKADLFERSDVLSLHLRLRADTSGMIGPEDLARMKPTALLVNTSRAELIQSGALLSGLRNGRPGYAALDVYEKEPVTGGDHPLFAMPNVLCTPHLGWAEWDNFELYFRECFEQIAAYHNGAPMRILSRP